MGLPETSVRSTTVLTKKPTSSWAASSSRPATAQPSGMSVPLPYRVSRAARAACSTMNTLACRRRARSTTARYRSGPIASGTEPPR